MKRQDPADVGILVYQNEQHLVILNEARNLKMHAYENFASFLARKFAKINDAWEKFDRYLENWLIISRGGKQTPMR